ncbi:MAG: ComF family protein [Bacteroidaceae bacterium]|nr:ComF family protein [Bacteroidaceae bacterium]
MSDVSAWLRDFRDLLNPRFCAICGCRLTPTEQKLCGACLTKLPYLLSEGWENNLSARLFWGQIPVERAYSHILYEPESDSHRLLMQMKYNHRPDLCRWVGHMLAENLQPGGFFEGIEAIVPVPLHWRRLWKRGYNQSFEMALGVSDLTRLPILKHAVKRVRNNVSQTHMSASERIRNVQGLFRALSGLPCHHILLVDDVLTTGATLSACARAISDANSQVRFSFLTLARTHDGLPPVPASEE